MRVQAVVGLLEFGEIEARDFGDDVVNRRFEGSGRHAAGDFVFQLVQGVADGQTRGDRGNREAGRFRGQRRGARDARVHFDDDDAAVARVDGELHVGTAGFHADFTQDGDGGIAQRLIFLVGQRLRRSDGDGVAGMHAHRVKIFDGADDDGVVRLVAHHFHLKLFPAEQRFLQQHLVRRRQLQPMRGNLLEFVAVIGDAAARTAESEGRADDDRKTQFRLRRACFLQRMHRERLGARETNLAHRLFEQIAVFRRLNRLHRGANQRHAVALQHAVFGKIQRAVERRLPAHRRQNRVRPLLGDNLLHRLPLNRLDIRRIRHLRVGHNRRRIGIDENDAEALAAQRLARLRAGIIELAGLADDNRASANNQDGFQVGTFGHGELQRQQKTRGFSHKSRTAAEKKRSRRGLAKP